MTIVRRALVLLIIPLGALVLGAGAAIFYPWPVEPARSFELVAHRGVHQTHPLRDEGVADDTCTASIIDPPTHGFLENTIPSIQAAYAAGATAVEIDIHRTADDHLVVFHDWTLDCRTDGTGVTNERPLAYLERLDVGHGYTADGGQTFPFRGHGVGMMPTLPEVLAAFPGGRFVIHDKDGDLKTRQLLIDLLATLPAERRAQLLLWGGTDSASIRRQLPEIQPYLAGPDALRGCLGDYLLRMVLTGGLPERCRQQIIGIPYSMLASIPGWPHLILDRAHQAGARVFVTDVDTPEQWSAIAHLPLDGIQTNRIEVIGPLVGYRTGGDAAVP